MNLQSNDFELLGLTPAFAIDEAQLAARWKALQSQVHPDKFVASTAAEKRVAMQWSVRINEAYQRLRTPLKRAAYLCELNGAALGEEDNTAMPAAFLMQQMEWREALDEADTPAALTALEREVKAYEASLLGQLAALIDEQRDWPAAAAKVRALMFVARFMDTLDGRQTALAERLASRVDNKG